MTFFIRKCADYGRSFRGYKMMTFQWSATKIQWRLRTTPIRMSVKFDVNPMSGLSKNAWKLNAYRTVEQKDVKYKSFCDADGTFRYIKICGLSYFFDMAPIIFHKVEVPTFQKMYGGTCHLKWYRWTNFMGLAHGLTCITILSCRLQRDSHGGNLISFHTITLKFISNNDDTG